MTWFHFSLWLIGLYGLYYLFNILFDLLYKHQHEGSSDPSIHEITFIEDQIAKKVSIEKLRPKKTILPVISSTVGLGGVSLSGLFELARTEAIEVTKPIVF